MRTTIITTILITSILAKNYLIEAGDVGGHERGDREAGEEGDKGGSDFSLNPSFRMEIDGQF